MKTRTKALAKTKRPYVNIFRVRLKLNKDALNVQAEFLKGALTEKSFHQHDWILKKNAVDLTFVSIKKPTIMSILNTGKNKKDKKKSTLPASKSAFIAPKVKANTKSSGKGGKHVGGAQRGA